MPLSQSQLLQNGTPWHDTKRFVCSILGCWANLRPPKWKFLPVGPASVRLLPMGSILCLDPILDPLLSRKCLPAFESCLCFRIITLFSTYSPCTGAGRFLQYSEICLNVESVDFIKQFEYMYSKMYKEMLGKTVGKEKMYTRCQYIVLL